METYEGFSKFGEDEVFQDSVAGWVCGIGCYGLAVST